MLKLTPQAQTKAVGVPVAAQPATKGTSISRVVTSSIVPVASSSVTVKVAVSSAVTTPRVVVVPSSSTTISSSISKTTSITPSSSSTSTSTSLSPSPTPSESTTVLILTSTTSTSAASTATLADAAQLNSTHTSMSTGAIAGIALGVLVGVVVLGSMLGWVYKRWINRGYGTKPWAKIEDDISPFHEKTARLDDDDFYGATAAPVIGSSRALNLARQNAFNPDGSFRPTSEFMDPANNRAGYGAGAAALGQYSSYPEMRNVPYEPYQSQRGGRPQVQLYSDEPPRHSPPNNSRQLLGPGPQQPYGYDAAEYIAPVPMGRPAPPSSEAGLMAAEEYSDMPTPRTATSMGEWTGYPVMPHSMPDARHFSQGSSAPSGTGYSGPSPTGSTHPLPLIPQQSRSLSPPQTNLPTLQPLSPLMGAFGLPEAQRMSQPLPMYQDEPSEQKRLYGEVARTAGVAEPLTPAYTPGLNHSHGSNGLGRSVSSATSATYSSFSATDPVPRLPAQHAPSPPYTESSHLPVAPPTVVVQPPQTQVQAQGPLQHQHQPYVHGRPLSPLAEVPTPLSAFMPMPPAAPSSNLHGAQSQPQAQPQSQAQREINPFDALPVSVSQASLAPPFSAVPIARFPPASPGAMSVPGSVGDSPASQRRTRQSVFDQEDAYGGI